MAILEEVVPGFLEGSLLKSFISENTVTIFFYALLCGVHMNSINLKLSNVVRLKLRSSVRCISDSLTIILTKFGLINI